jgi:microcystin degradation protein MlrC
MPHRFVVARFQHETNTFSSLPTTPQSFQTMDLTRRHGNAAIADGKCWSCIEFHPSAQYLETGTLGQEDVDDDQPAP